MRKRDAIDLAYIFEKYEYVKNIRKRIFDEFVAENYDWEMPLAGAHLLGYDSATIAKNKTKVKISQILKNNLKQDTFNKLVEEMCKDIEKDYQDKIKLLQAFTNGFKSVDN